MARQGFMKYQYPMVTKGKSGGFVAQLPDYVTPKWAYGKISAPQRFQTIQRELCPTYEKTGRSGTGEVRNPKISAVSDGVYSSKKFKL